MRFFEWPQAPRLVGWLWVPLLILLAAPWPMYGWPLPERAVPIFWLLLGGALLVAAQIARASWPFALLFLWAVTRAGMMQFPQRAIQLLLLIAMVGLLYVAARELPARADRWLGWALLAGLAWEVALGYANLWHWYPWMTFIQSGQSGRPMGLLTHPNYWGSYVALALPMAWSLLGILPVVALFALLLASWSPGPVISAAVALVLLAGCRLDRRVRWLGILGLAGATAAVMQVHEWRLSGRIENWQAVWPELRRYLWTGQGLGGWRTWAEHYNAKHGCCFATLQAHNEPYQLWFELGLIGLSVGILWTLQAALAARAAWRTAGPSGGAWAWWSPGWVPFGQVWPATLAVAAVNMLGSPTFHLPAQAAITLLALARVQTAISKKETPHA